MNPYEPHGDGPLYRLPPSIKLAALFGLSILLFLPFSAAVVAGIAAVVAIGSLAYCREGVAQWLRTWPLLLAIVAFAAWTAFADGRDAALIVLIRLGTLSLFATVITATTTVGQFIETITGLVRPLEAIGLGNARDVGLAIGLVIRFIPEVHARYRSVADAHRARGLKRRLSTIVVPMVIGTLQSADEIANAIDARNIRSETTE